MLKGEDENGRCSEKEEGIFWSKFGSLYTLSRSVLPCLQLHREEIYPGSVYGMQFIRAGTAPSLPSRGKCTVVQVQTCTQPSPSILGLWKTWQKRHFCLCREWLQSSCRALGSGAENGLVQCLCMAVVCSIPTVMGAHTVAINGVVFQTLLFTFKMMKLSSHSY